MYKCVSKRQGIKRYVTQEKNEHGAMNDIWQDMAVWELIFNYEAVPENQYQVPNGILHVNHVISLTDTHLADCYTVGGMYDKLPGV